MIASDGDSHHILEDGEVVYEGNRIIFTGHGYDGPVDEVIDAGNAVIGPGFVDLDALFDLDSTILGFDNHPGWAKARVWASTYVERGPRDVYTDEEEDFQHEYAMVQLLLNGITTALPIRSILYRAWAETYDENARAAEIAARLGIRIYLGPSYRTGLPMVNPDGQHRHALGHRARHARAGRRHPLRPRFRRRPRRADPRLPPTRPDRGLHRRAARPHRRSRRASSIARSGCTAARASWRCRRCTSAGASRRWRVLHDLGFLSRRALLPHGIYLGGIEPTPEQVERELGWLAESGATIVHCPLVIARHGDASWTRSRASATRGISIGLGTDTFPPDIVAEHARPASWRRASATASRCAPAPPTTTHAATIGGADALGRPDLGRLTPGALADITIFDLDGSHLGQFIDPIQTMVLNGSGRDFTTVIVNGRTVVRDRQLAGYRPGRLARARPAAVREADRVLPGARASAPAGRGDLHAVVSDPSSTVTPA